VRKEKAMSKAVGKGAAPGGRRINRRRFLELGGAGLAGAVLLGSGTLAGCGGSEQDGGGAVGITFTFGPDASGGLQTLIDRFNEEHKGEINVTWRTTPAASDEYFEQIKTQLQSGQATVDVIGGDVIWPAQLAAQGYVLDLSDRFTAGMRERYLEGPLQATEYDGKTYAVPWFTDAGMFYYRKDLLEESGFSEPPKTWDEMKQMGDRVRSGSGIKYGYVFQGARDEGGVVDALEYIWNAGGDVLDGNDVIIDSPEAAEGLEIRRSMITDGVAPEASGEYTTQESQAIFTNGDAVFMRNWPFVYGLLASPETSKVRPEQVDLANIPVSDARQVSFSGLGGWNFLVNAASEDKLDEIWTFIEFMSSAASQKTLALKSTRLPTLKDLYEDREVLEKVPVAALGKESLENTRPRPVSPYYSDMSLVMAEQFNAALKGSVPVGQALQTLQSELQNIVNQS
jgi:multiple sugar transport system substrate-binding protein